MSKSSNTRRRINATLEPFDERIAILFEELALAIKWKRPSILLAVYRSENLRAAAQIALEHQVLTLRQHIHPLKVNPEQFDVPRVLSQLPKRSKSIFFITGLKWGGGKGGYNAYRALNIRREFFVDYQLRAVFWLTEGEAVELSLQAPDFWAFRHRVVEFTDTPPAQSMIPSAGHVWDEWDPGRLGEDPDAKIALREALLEDLPPRSESEATRADLLYSLAPLHWIKGEHHQSIELLKQGLGIAQELHMPGMQSRFWVGMGIVYHDLKQFKDALAAFQQAIELDPGDSMPWSNLSDAYQDMGQNRKALHAGKKALRLNPADAQAWNNLGNVYYDIKQYEDASRAYQKAIDLEPNDARPWIGIGNIHLNNGRAEEAIRAYKKASKLAPANANSWKNLGSTYLSLGRNKEATHALKKAAKLDPQNADLWINLGHAYGDQGHDKQARRAFQKADELKMQAKGRKT